MFLHVFVRFRCGTCCRRKLSPTTGVTSVICCAWTGRPSTQTWSGPEGRTSPCRSGESPNKSLQSRLKVSTCLCCTVGPPRTTASSSDAHMLLFTGKKMLELKEKTKTNPKQKKKNKKPPGAGGAAPLEMNGGPVAGPKAAKEQEPSEDEEDEVSSTNSSAPTGNRAQNKSCYRFEKWSDCWDLWSQPSSYILF